MAQKIQAIRGMNDYLPADTRVWQKIENTLKQILAGYGFSEIRTPIVEHTPLFQRAIGEVTDVVEKEMYTFTDRGEDAQSLTLRPENTAGCVRAGIEHGLLYNQEQRLWYLGPMFRYERPQKGRYRQFHQLGAEVFGLQGPDIDAELIMLTARWWRALGIAEHVTLELNSIGSLEARAKYREALVAFLEQHVDQLDEDCKRRMYSNPLRVLDSKNPEIQTLLNDAPELFDYLDDESREHFDGLCALLDAVGITYRVNQRLVRGLDYYNRTVFEWVTSALGSQGTVCAGGRYDGLVSAALMLAEEIRDQLPTLRLMTNHGKGNFKKQLGRADKHVAKIALILGEDEINAGTVAVKDLRSGEQTIVSRSELAQQLTLLLG